MHTAIQMIFSNVGVIFQAIVGCVYHFYFDKKEENLSNVQTIILLIF